jgi:hypothetical protein
MGAVFVQGHVEMENERKVEGACYCIEVGTLWREWKAQKVKVWKAEASGNEKR